MLSRRVRNGLDHDEYVVRQSVADYWATRFGASADWLAVKLDDVQYAAVYASDSPGLLLIGWTKGCPRPDPYR